MRGLVKHTAFALSLAAGCSTGMYVPDTLPDTRPDCSAARPFVDSVLGVAGLGLAAATFAGDLQGRTRSGFPNYLGVWIIGIPAGLIGAIFVASAVRGWQAHGACRDMRHRPGRDYALVNLELAREEALSGDCEAVRERGRRIRRFDAKVYKDSFVVEDILGACEAQRGKHDTNED